MTTEKIGGRRRRGRPREVMLDDFSVISVSVSVLLFNFCFHYCHSKACNIFLFIKSSVYIYLCVFPGMHAFLFFSLFFKSVFVDGKKEEGGIEVSPFSNNKNMLVHF